MHGGALLKSDESPEQARARCYHRALAAYTSHISKGRTLMDLGLKGRTALVTGGSRGIGYGVARVLAAEGCHLHHLFKRDMG